MHSLYFFLHFSFILLGSDVSEPSMPSLLDMSERIDTEQSTSAWTRSRNVDLRPRVRPPTEPVLDCSRKPVRWYIIRDRVLPKCSIRCENTSRSAFIRSLERETKTPAHLTQQTHPAQGSSNTPRGAQDLHQQTAPSGLYKLRDRHLGLAQGTPLSHSQRPLSVRIQPYH